MLISSTAEARHAVTQVAIPNLTWRLHLTLAVRKGFTKHNMHPTPARGHKQDDMDQLTHTSPLQRKHCRRAPVRNDSTASADAFRGLAGEPLGSSAPGAVGARAARAGAKPDAVIALRLILGNTEAVWILVTASAVWNGWAWSVRTQKKPRVVSEIQKCFVVVLGNRGDTMWGGRQW